MTLYVSEYVEIEVDDDTMVEHLENQGWIVVHQDEYDENPFTDEERDLIAATFIDSPVGSVGYEIYQKARKR